MQPVFVLRMREKEYLINDRDVNFAAIADAERRLREVVDARIARPERKERLLALLRQYSADIGKYAQTKEQLLTIKESYLGSLRDVEPALLQLHQLSRHSADAALGGIWRTGQIMRVTGVSSIVLVIASATGLAAFVVFRIKAVEAKLTVSERNYRILFETSPDAIMLVDRGLSVVTVNHRLAALLGYDEPGDMQGRPAPDFIASRDRGPVTELLTGSICREHRGESEFRMLRRDGSAVPVESVCSMIPGESANAGSLIVAIRDVTARKQAEDRALSAQEYARHIVNSSLDMIIAVDPERRIVEFNRAAEDVFGYRKEELAGCHIEVLYAGEAESARVRAAMLRDGWFIGEIMNRKKSGETFPTLLSASIIRDSLGKPSGFMGVSRDITEMKRIEEELKAAATVDKLTGVYNRRKFELIVEQEIDRAVRYRHPLSLIILDIDHFKDVNDRHGHLAGDKVLQTTAARIGENIRKTDAFGRWGGEEFMILVPEAAGTEAGELAEKIRRLIESGSFGEAGRITISCGVTELMPGDSMDSLIRRADEALYQAKRQGRNRVAVSADDPEQA